MCTFALHVGSFLNVDFKTYHKAADEKLTVKYHHITNL